MRYPAARSGSAVASPFTRKAKAGADRYSMGSHRRPHTASLRRRRTSKDAASATSCRKTVTA
ncbi:hypothetical protein J2S43_001100 [Catenuloplanes nepalensis]|uniref:Uncharacterized protein n=1 Tax=Catenuloplanes nepalensis TaxID=587533 RepID=A0ABT9MMR0_9ACTN|nr:hypothetical protein [Catenuloplanes nepalensis]